MSDEPEHFRWIVTITYRVATGTTEVEHHVEELDDIAEIIERGPDWNSVVEGKFRLNPARSTHAGLTVEGADEL